MATTTLLHPTEAHNFSQTAHQEPRLQATVDSNYVPRGDTVATLHYITQPADGSTPFNYVEKQPEGQPQNNYGISSVDVPIRDIRGHESEYTLDRDAFAVVPNVLDSTEKDWVDDDSVEKNYYPEVEKLILDNIPGSNKIFIFDHTIRRSDPKSPRDPVFRVHIDQTAKSAIQRVRFHLPKEAEKLLQGRFRIVNVWRPLNGPVQTSPLAFASSASFRDEDLIPVEHRYPDRTGETAGIVHNPGQEWHYLSGMENNERLLLECFDSEALKPGSKVQGGRVPHTAFKDTRSPEDARGRASIEVRALVFGP